MTRIQRRRTRPDAAKLSLISVPSIDPIDQIGQLDSAFDAALIATPPDVDSSSLESRGGVTCLADAALPTRYGHFRIKILRSDEPGTETVALVRGDVAVDEPVLVRLHSECLTSEVLGSVRCDCAEQLAAALALIGASDRGVLVYLRQEGRGIGLVNKIRAYALQDRGLDTVDANLALGLPVDGREYSSAANILAFLGIRRVRLLTNNPLKQRALLREGIEVVERVPLEMVPNSVNLTYLQAKATRLGHFLTIDPLDPVGGGTDPTTLDLPERKSA